MRIIEDCLASLFGKLEVEYPVSTNFSASRQFPLLLTYEDKIAVKGVFNRVQKTKAYLASRILHCDINILFQIISMEAF